MSDTKTKTPITDTIAFNLTATMAPNTNVEALKYVLGKMREMEVELIEARQQKHDPRRY